MVTAGQGVEVFGRPELIFVGRSADISGMAAPVVDRDRDRAISRVGGRLALLLVSGTITLDPAVSTGHECSKTFARSAALSAVAGEALAGPRVTHRDLLGDYHPCVLCSITSSDSNRSQARQTHRQTT